MGWFITLETPSRPMKKEATEAGFYKTAWGNHPRIQILTVIELLEGVAFSCPPIRPSGTTYKLPRRVGREGKQSSLMFTGVEPEAEEIEP